MVVARVAGTRLATAETISMTATTSSTTRVSSARTPYNSELTMPPAASVAAMPHAAPMAASSIPWRNT